MPDSLWASPSPCLTGMLPFSMLYQIVLLLHLEEVMSAWLAGRGMLGKKLSGRKSTRGVQPVKSHGVNILIHRGQCQARMIYEIPEQVKVGSLKVKLVAS